MRPITQSVYTVVNPGAKPNFACSHLRICFHFNKCLFCLRRFLLFSAEQSASGKLGRLSSAGPPSGHHSGAHFGHFLQILLKKVVLFEAGKETLALFFV